MRPEDPLPARLGPGPDGAYAYASTPPGGADPGEDMGPVEGDVTLMMDDVAGPFWDTGGLLDHRFDRLHDLLGISRELHDDAVAWGEDAFAGRPGVEARRLALLRRLRAEVRPGVEVSQDARRGSRPRVLHVAYASHWAEAQATGDYPWSTRGMTYDEVGFVHCAEPDQVEGVIARFYADAVEPLVLLELDPAALESAAAQVRWEPAPGGEVFPHLYAALRPAYVLETLDRR